MLIRPAASDESGEIRAIGKSASLQSAGYSHQVFDVHVPRQRITTWFGDLAPDIYSRSLNSFEAAVDDQSVAGLQDDVVDWISIERFAKVHAENLHGAVGLGAE